MKGLMTHDAGICAGTMPVHFINMATPHLSCETGASLRSCCLKDVLCHHVVWPGHSEVVGAGAQTWAAKQAGCSITAAMPAARGGFGLVQEDKFKGRTQSKC